MINVARILLLSTWLFAILVPSMVLLSDKDTVLVINLNEEEQQETGKKVQAEEDIVNQNPFDFFSLIAQSEVWTAEFRSAPRHIDYTLEILLPPPEHLSPSFV